MDEIPADVLKAALECWLGMEEVERIPVEPVPAIARAIMAERERCANDAARLDWLERKHTLHRTIGILYVVDGYRVREEHDYEPIGKAHYGETLRDAMDAAIRGEP